MYLGGHDVDQSVAVWILDRPTNEEWRRFTLDILRVAQWEPSRRPLVLFVAEHFTPDSGQIHHLVELIGSSNFGPRVAVVTVGVLARGFTEALATAPNVATFDDLDDAFDFLAAQRPDSVRMVRELWRETNLTRPPHRETEQA